MIKMIYIRHKGGFNRVEKWFNKLMSEEYFAVLYKYAEKGLASLSANTPVDTGKTAASWVYEIEMNPEVTKIIYSNTNVNKGVNIAIILQYGHGTGTGGYVAGRDYINPALQPVFDEMVEELCKEVTSV